jgi:hypothetical protein
MESQSATAPGRDLATATVTHSPQQRPFETMLPAIQGLARAAFRRLPATARDEAVQDVVAAAFVAYTRLVDRGQTERAFATPLARYGIAHVRSGRRVGVCLNSGDVLSLACQRHGQFRVESLSRPEGESSTWQDLVVEDHRSSPAEIAAARLDLSAWFATLSPRRRAIAAVLATGESTAMTARSFRVSRGRISQVRRELEAAWCQFQGTTGLATA